MNILESSYTNKNSSKGKQFDKNIIPELNLSQKQDKDSQYKLALSKII